MWWWFHGLCLSPISLSWHIKYTPLYVSIIFQWSVLEQRSKVRERLYWGCSLLEASNLPPSPSISPALPGHLETICPWRPELLAPLRNCLLPAPSPHRGDFHSLEQGSVTSGTQAQSDERTLLSCQGFETPPYSMGRAMDWIVPPPSIRMLEPQPTMWWYLDVKPLGDN
jgi:hypothetical protein